MAILVSIARRVLFGVLCIVAVAGSVLVGLQVADQYAGVHRSDYVTQP